VDFPAGKFPWDSLAIQFALDTHLPLVGQHRLPYTGVQSELGFEFLIDLRTPDSANLGVAPDYNRYDSRVDPATGDDFGRFSRRPAVTRNRSDARFDSLFMITNRARFGRDGTFYRARRYDRGRLHFGTETESTLSDWYFEAATGLLQLRIPWDLINVTDPATRTLLADRDSIGNFGTAPAQDFHIGLVVYRKQDGEVAAALPELHTGVWRASDFQPWRWRDWTVPHAHARLKPVYDSLMRLWRAAPFEGRARPARTAPSD
jgi:hypothetical protein